MALDSAVFRPIWSMVSISSQKQSKIHLEALPWVNHWVTATFNILRSFLPCFDLIPV